MVNKSIKVFLRDYYASHHAYSFPRNFSIDFTPVSVFYKVVRILGCAFFCAFYFQLSRVSEYSVFPNIKWTKNDVEPVEKYFYIGIGIFMGAVSAVITARAIQTFLPIFGNFSNLIAVLNGLIIALPVVSHYWVLKM